jgi:hypothetical protein
MTGDGGGCHVKVEQNVLIDPGQYGIAVAGGSFIEVSRNVVWGEPRAYSNVGLYVWNQHRSTCREITVLGNQVRFYNKRGMRNDLWNGKNCGRVGGWQANRSVASRPPVTVCQPQVESGKMGNHLRGILR